MATFLLVVHCFVCLVLVFLVLIQSGRDGGIGMMGGGGSNQTIFGSSGGANFFTKLTSGIAAVFMITSIFLTVTKDGKRTSVFADQPGATPPAATNQAPASTTTAPQATKEAPSAPAAESVSPSQNEGADAKKK